MTPAYSTDIADAWKVVEKLIKDGFEVTVEGIPNTEGKTFWNCSIEDPSYARESALGQGTSAPHAICLAALKFVGYEEKE